MLPTIYGENLFDDFFSNGFFNGHDPLFGKNGKNLMKTDIRESDDAKGYRLAVDLPRRVLTRTKRIKKVAF